MRETVLVGISYRTDPANPGNKHHTCVIERFAKNHKFSQGSPQTGLRAGREAESVDDVRARRHIDYGTSGHNDGKDSNAQGGQTDVVCDTSLIVK